MSAAHHPLPLVVSIFKTKIDFVAACWEDPILRRRAESIRCLFLLLVLVHVLHVVPLGEVLSVYQLVSRIILLERLLGTLIDRVLQRLVLIYSFNSAGTSERGRALEF